MTALPQEPRRRARATRREHRRAQLRILGVHRSRLRPGEIGVDLFAGGGGYSEGYQRAVGQPPAVAVNHDAHAIAMHTLNHPEAEHWLEDVFHVDPHGACRGRLVGVLHGSPDCTHFSKAKGDVPKSKKIRGLAWAIVRWAAEVSPRIVSLENVEEFLSWGPLNRDGRPIKRRAGETFHAFVACLTTGLRAGHAAYADMRSALVGEPPVPCTKHPKRRRRSCDACTAFATSDYPRMPLARYRAVVKACQRGLGYDIEWRSLRACDYGAPTSRKRLYVVGRRDGEPICWPAPTHGPKTRKPYRTAAECIDWKDLGVSIFLEGDEARTFGVKRPLAIATQRRIAEGIRRYVLDNPRPFLVPYHSARRPEETPRTHDVADPLPTQTVENRFAVVTPTLMSNNTNNAPHDVDEPLGTITTGNRHFLVAPHLVGAGGPAQSGTPTSVDKPLGTVMPENNRCVVAPILTTANGHGFDAEGGAPTAPADRPMRTVITKDSKALVSPQLLNLSHGGRTEPADEPLNTITATPKGGDRALVAPQLLNITHGSPAESIEKPMRTVTAAHRGEKALIAPVLARTAHGEQGKNGRKRRGRGAHPVDETLPTVTGSNDMAMVAPTLIRTDMQSDGHLRGIGSVEEPLRTITTNGGHAVIAPTLIQTSYGEREGQAPRVLDLHEPLGTVVAQGQKHGLVETTLIPEEAATGFISKYYSDQGQRPGTTLDEPLSTVTTYDHNALITAKLGHEDDVAAFLVRNNTGMTARDLKEVLPTVCARETMSLGVAHITKFNTGSVGSAIDEPVPTITGGGGATRPAGAAHGLGVVTAHVITHNGKSIGSPAEAPLPTVTAGGMDHQGVVATHITKFNGTSEHGAPIDDPLHTVTAGGGRGGGHLGVAAVHMEKFYGEGGQWSGADEPMHTLTTKDRIALVAAFLRRHNVITDDREFVSVQIDGETFVLYDIAMRMLQPRELARAQGFPDSYKLTGTKSQQVARVGNSVCPDVAAAIVRANLDSEEVAA